MIARVGESAACGVRGAWIPLGLTLLLAGVTAAAPREVVVTGDVVDAGGKPMAGAELFFQARGALLFTQDEEVLPLPLDAQGRFKLTLPAAGRGDPVEYLGTLWAFAPGHRPVDEWLAHDPTQPFAPVRLEFGPAAGFRMKVLDPDGTPLAGALVLATSWAVLQGARPVRSPDCPPKVLRSRWEVSADDEGVAVLPVAGRAEIVRGVEITSPRHGRQEFHNDVESPGGWTVRLAPVGRVSGQVMAGRPEAVRGLIVLATTRAEVSRDEENPIYVEGSAQATTDAQGRFEIPAVAAGELSLEFELPPRPSHLPEPLQSVRLEAGTTRTFEVTLKPAVRVRGIVREKATGEPLPDVSIRVESPSSSASDGSLRTDAAGRFETYVLPGDLSLEADARSGHPPVLAGPWSTVVPEGVRERAFPPIELLLAHGRVLDERARPVPEATVGFLWRRPEEQGEVSSGRLGHQFQADSQGHYRMWVDPRCKGCLAFGAKQRVTWETGWINLAKLPNCVLPDGVLRPTEVRRIDPWAVAVRVVDRHGRPVSGASVFAGAGPPKHVGPATDADGKCRLQGISQDGAFLFVEKAGFRFHGQGIRKGTGPVEVVLARAEEPARRTLKTLPLATPRPRRLEIARALIEPELRKFLAGQGRDSKDRFPASDVLRALAIVDPERARRLLKENAIQSKEDRADLERELASSRQARMPRDALPADLLNDASDPALRARNCLSRCDAAPRSEPKQRLEHLEKALAQARLVKKPSHRMSLFGQIAERLLDLGRHAEAVKLFGEAQALAKTLPRRKFGDPRADLTERLARLDLPAALELLKDVHEQEQHRALVTIASVLARSNPAGAEHALDLLRSQRDFGAIAGDVIVGVCGRMATVDLARARRIAEAANDLDDAARAKALMAQVLAKSQPAVAAELLRQSFADLQAAAESQTRLASRAAGLLPVAEQIDPSLVDELLWRAISLRLLAPEDPQEAFEFDYPGVPHVAGLEREDVLLAALVARYDAAAAQAVFAAAWSRIPPRCRAMAADTAAMVDPQQAVAALDVASAWVDRAQMAIVLAIELAAEDANSWKSLQTSALGREEFGDQEALDAPDRPLPLLWAVPDWDE